MYPCFRSAELPVFLHVSHLLVLAHDLYLHPQPHPRSTHEGELSRGRFLSSVADPLYFDADQGPDPDPTLNR